MTFLRPYRRIRSGDAITSPRPGNDLAAPARHERNSWAQETFGLMGRTPDLLWRVSRRLCGQAQRVFDEAGKTIC